MLASQNNESHIGHTKIHLSSVDSTNNYAANMMKEGHLSHGTVILADEQTNGRGQRGAVWQSEPGMNLQMSFVLAFDNLILINQRFINCFVSISLVSFLKKRGVEAKIKWPNDILVNNKKIGGILIENQLKNQCIKSSIVGVGFNVNQIDFGDLFATSFKLETHVFTPISEVLDAMLWQFNNYFEIFQTEHFSQLENEYFESLWGYRELKTFSDENGPFLGEIMGVSENGQLIVQRAEGKKEYDIKELKFNLDS